MRVLIADKFSERGIERLREAMTRTPGMRDRIVSPAEQEYCERRRDPAERYAARFAAKEAVLKAMGCGLGSCAVRDIQVAADQTAGTAVRGAERHHRHAAGAERPVQLAVRADPGEGGDVLAARIRGRDHDEVARRPGLQVSRRPAAERQHELAVAPERRIDRARPGGGRHGRRRGEQRGGGRERVQQLPHDS